MKIRFSLHVIGALASIFMVMAVISACNKSYNSTGPAPGTSSVTSILKNANDATVFYAAITRVHLDSVFNGAGPFTLFVPTDQAFASSGITPAALGKLSDDSLRYLILYHTLAANVLSSGLPAGPNAKIITANGDSIFVTNAGTAIYINGVPLLAADVLANNGVIHATQLPLIPPAGNLMQTIQGDTSFSFLVAAINKASQGTTDINALLSTGGPYTLFAPINNGFRNAGYATIDAFDSLSADSVANIVLYHMLPARKFSQDLVSGQTAKTLNDSSVVFSVGNNTKQIKGDKNNSPANAIGVNIMATNGVLFVIDQVLQP